MLPEACHKVGSDYERWEGRGNSKMDPIDKVLCIEVFNEVPDKHQNYPWSWFYRSRADVYIPVTTETK